MELVENKVHILRHQVTSCTAVILEYFNKKKRIGKHFLDIHRNLKQKHFFGILWGIFEIIQFILNILMDKHLDGAWDMFWIKSINGTSIALQLKPFSLKIFWITCRGQKVPFWQFFRKGQDGRALLVQPSRIPHRISKTSILESRVCAYPRYLCKKPKDSSSKVQTWIVLKDDMNVPLYSEILAYIETYVDYAP